MGVLRPSMIKSCIVYIDNLSSYVISPAKRECINAALNKHIPLVLSDDGGYGKCPVCGYEFNSELINEYEAKYCLKCGQKIE